MKGKKGGGRKLGGIVKIRNPAPKEATFNGGGGIMSGGAAGRVKDVNLGKRKNKKTNP